MLVNITKFVVKWSFNEFYKIQTQPLTYFLFKSRFFSINDKISDDLP